MLGRLLSLPFLLAAVSSALFTVGMLGIYYDVVDLLVKAGYSPPTAALVFGSTWLVSAAGSLVFGLLADRFGPVRVLAGVVFACACGTLCLLGTTHPRYGAVCLVAFILLWGSTGNGFTQLLPAVFVERFGPTHLGTVLGVQFAIAGVIGALAPMITGLLVDRSGDYHVAITVSASATFVSAVLASLIGFGKSAPRFPGAVQHVTELK
jgi:MFS family permease